MNSFPYFTDVLDRLSQYLVSRKDWETLEQIFNVLRAQESGGPVAAAYAWILGRAIEENYYPSEKTQEDYFRMIFDEIYAPLYYRIMSSWKLGLTLVSKSEEKKPIQKNAEMEFLQGFFTFNAAALALPYIRSYEGRLSLPELRILAASLAEAGRTNESLNLITRYMRREDFQTEDSKIIEADSRRGVYPMSREDLALYYPRPFQETIEKYAQEMGLGPEILYALIRTESYFMADAVSRVGATGLTQLMPATAQDMAARMARQSGPQGRLPDYRTVGAVEGGIDLKNPEINVHIGSFYLNYLNDLMGTPMTAILAYNGGLGRVRRWRSAETMPEDLFLETIEYEETREYGRRVLAAAAIYGYLYYGVSMEEVVADIYR
jgi:soluble lytic murein transglycosylase